MTYKIVVYHDKTAQVYHYTPSGWLRRGVWVPHQSYTTEAEALAAVKRSIPNRTVIKARYFDERGCEDHGW